MSTVSCFWCLSAAGAAKGKTGHHERASGSVAYAIKLFDCTLFASDYFCSAQSILSTLVASAVHPRSPPGMRSVLSVIWKSRVISRPISGFAVHKRGRADHRARSVASLSAVLSAFHSARG